MEAQAESAKALADLQAERIAPAAKPGRMSCSGAFEELSALLQARGAELESEHQAHAATMARMEVLGPGR